MGRKSTLQVVLATSVMLASAGAVGVGAVAANREGAAVLAAAVRDPLAVFSQRSPGERPPGALFQTKRAKVFPLALVPPPPAPPIAAPPPVLAAADHRLCEQLTTPVSAVAVGPVSPEVESLAGPLVSAVQQALAAHQESAAPEREAAVEQAIEQVLEGAGASPDLARSALDVVQARLAALGVSCAPGVPQAMQVASVAVTQAATPAALLPASLGPLGPAPFSTPPLTGGGGGGGGATHPSAQ